MDYGDDPLVSAHYADAHARAAEAVAPARRGMLDDIRQRREWAGSSLSALKDKSVTPEMLVASGVRWDKLHTTHGGDAAIAFGFRWPAMLASGFSGRHLATLSLAQVASLGLTAARMMECRPRIEHIAALGMDAEQMHDMGWTPELLSAAGLSMRSMVDFGFPMQVWRDVLGVRDFGALGFRNYSECARMGWRDSDIRLALQSPARAAGPSAAAGGPIRFI